MTATLLDVRQGIKAVLETVDGIDTVYGFQHASPTPTCAIVDWPSEYDPQVVLHSGFWDAVIPVRILVALTDNENADLQLSNLLEPIVQAFNDDPNVADNATAIVGTVDQFGPVALADQGVLYLQAVFNVHVLAS